MKDKKSFPELRYESDIYVKSDSDELQKLPI